nr:aldose epimerase family protein [uncultured Niameybacter sp.]
MHIQVEEILLKDMRKCECITLKNSQGAFIEILTLGGILKSVNVPDSMGNIENVVLEYEDINTYIENPGYINAIIGRTAGRIYKGEFTLMDKKYVLYQNENTNNLHGGKHGFDKQIWNPEYEKEEGRLAVTLRYISEDMEEGYPGRLEVEVTYTFTEDNVLGIHYEATADQDTVVNLTNHAYFNLSGDAKRPITDQELSIKSDFICELDHESIPTGKLLSVAKEEVFDFNRSKLIGKDIEKNHLQLQYTKGYDHPWLLKEGADCVKLYDPTSKRAMTITTDQKAVVVYTMNYQNPSKFKGDVKNGVRYGVCFETQQLPVGYNEVFKEGIILKKGDIYKHKTEFKFSCK